MHKRHESEKITKSYKRLLKVLFSEGFAVCVAEVMELLMGPAAKQTAQEWHHVVTGGPDETVIERRSEQIFFFLSFFFFLLRELPFLFNFQKLSLFLPFSPI